LEGVVNEDVLTTTAYMRQQNTTSVLKAVRRENPLSRSDIAKSPSEKGLSGRDRDDSRRVLKPDLEAPCGPRPPDGSIAARVSATKPI